MFVEACVIILISCGSTSSSVLDVHREHLPLVIKSHPHLEEECKKNANCSVDVGKCWGYEDDCLLESRFGEETKNCKSDYYKEHFWNHLDFGYVRKLREEFKNLEICRPIDKDDSMLQCSRYTRFCKAKNIFINFHKVMDGKSNDKFREDLFVPGDIGGFCKLDRNLLKKQNEHKSPLQSWYAELENFSELDFNPMHDSKHCDITINETVVFMKMDFGGNMFHHFCDFFNLYVSQHVNGSWFGRDVRIVMWDAATSFYHDPFSLTWKVFSDKQVVPLVDWRGKKVCIRDVMLPLLPRMRGGLYYNTYVPQVCVGSNLFKSFSQHVTHRLKLPHDGVQERGGKPLLRVTLLERGKPDNEKVFRKVSNQNDLVKVLREFPDFKVQVVEYDWRSMDFYEQLSITHNSDIFIGMHGAGLTHLLFLPEWALAFELNNCGDAGCYSDLARLRGVSYLTWSNRDPSHEPKPSRQGKHPRYGDNPKFWDWWFDPRRFRELMREARSRVLEHPLFKEAWKKKFGKSGKSEL